MEYTGASIFGPERKKEKTAEGDVIGALSDQGSGDVMEVGMMDLDSSIEPSVSLREPSSLLGSWPSSYNNNLYTEGLCPSSNSGTVKKIPDSVDPGTEMPYPIDQGLDGTFASSFSLEKPSIVSSSTEPEVQLFLVDVRQTRSLLGENSAASNGKERFLLRHDHPFSFKFPMSLPEAPPNIGFSFSPRLESIPYENKFDQDKFGDPQSRPPKTAKRHYRSGTTSPDNVPLRVPVRMGRVTGETSPAGFQFVEPFHSDSGGLDITGPGTTCLLCAGPNISPRCDLSLDGNYTECCDQKLTQNICSNVDGGHGGNWEFSHRSGMAKNADPHVGDMGITCARGGLYGGCRVENYFDSA